MFKNTDPKDFAVVILTITVCIVLIVSTIGAVFYEKGNGRIEELIAFLLGSILTIIGEHILQKRKNREDES